MKERDNVLRILKGAKAALEVEDSDKMKLLSNQTINTASLTQDPDNIIVAVIVYSLSKIVGREKYKKEKGWNLFYKTISSSLDKSIKDVEKEDDESFRKDFERIKKAINKLSGDFRKYIQNVLRRAQINKASRIYEHGISMEQTASLLGITQYELAEYAGSQGISDTPENKTMSARQRVKLAERMFK